MDRGDSGGNEAPPAKSPMHQGHYSEGVARGNLLRRSGHFSYEGRVCAEASETCQNIVNLLKLLCTVKGIAGEASRCGIDWEEV